MSSVTPLYRRVKGVVRGKKENRAFRKDRCDVSRSHLLFVFDQRTSGLGS